MESEGRWGPNPLLRLRFLVPVEGLGGVVGRVRSYGVGAETGGTLRLNRNIVWWWTKLCAKAENRIGSKPEKIG